MNLIETERSFFLARLKPLVVGGFAACDTNGSGTLKTEVGGTQVLGHSLQIWVGFKHSPGLGSGGPKKTHPAGTIGVFAIGRSPTRNQEPQYRDIAPPVYIPVKSGECYPTAMSEIDQVATAINKLAALCREVAKPLVEAQAKLLRAFFELKS